MQDLILKVLKQIVNVVHAKFICLQKYVHWYLNIENEQRKLGQVAEMKKNVGVFNTQLQWQDVQMRYDQATGLYQDCIAIVSIHYETTQQSTRIHKLKIGEVHINLGKLLNTKTYRINKQYVLQKCYDNNAKLKVNIDLTQSQNQIIVDRDRNGGQFKQTKNTSLVFGVSKIRERMNEDQKLMLQTKLGEYEERIDKFRQSHKQQVRKLNDQIEKKDQKINILTNQNTSFGQVIQNLQIQGQKYRIKILSYEKQIQQVNEIKRTLQNTYEYSNSELKISKDEISQLNQKLQNLQQVYSKKQVHGKQQLQKYRQKYMESQNTRNKIIFEFQAKIKQEIKKKDDYYGQIISKLENKIQTNVYSIKQSLIKKERQLLALQEKYQRTQRAKQQLQQSHSSLQENRQRLQQQKSAMESELQRLVERLKSQENENEMSTFMIANLQQEFTKVKSQSKLLSKNNLEFKGQIEMANKTMDEQQAIISKLTRQAKIQKERQFYMQQKYQDQLQMKSYNEECIKGDTYYFRNQISKLNVKIKLLEQRVEQEQDGKKQVMNALEKVQNDRKELNRVFLENGIQIMKIQGQNKRLNEMIEQLQNEIKSKDMVYIDYSKKYQNERINLQKQLSNYVMSIKSLQAQLNDINKKRVQENNDWQCELNYENNQKVQLLGQLEREIERLNKKQIQLNNDLRDKQEMMTEVEDQLRSERQKNRGIEKQLLKLKFESSKIKDEYDSYLQKSQKYRNENVSLRNELQGIKGLYEKQGIKLSRQRQHLLSLIRWILDRNWENGQIREYLDMKGNVSIDSELISYVNVSVDKVYGILRSLNKNVEQLRQENERINGELNRNRLELQYKKEMERNEVSQDDFVFVKFQQQSNVQQTRIGQRYGQSIDKLGMIEFEELNRQLQKQLRQKSTKIEQLNEEINEQRQKNRKLNEQLLILRQDVQILNVNLTKRNVIINSMKLEIGDQVGGYYDGNRLNSNKFTGDYKADAEIKYKDQKLISQLQVRVEQLSRQNSLQRSKIELLESKLKSSGQKKIVDDQRIQLLQKDLKEMEEVSKKYKLENEQKEYLIDKFKKELEVWNKKNAKKQDTLNDYQREVESIRIVNQQFKSKVEELESKIAERERHFSLEISLNKKQVDQLSQVLRGERMERQRLGIEYNSEISIMKNVVKQQERRMSSLQLLLKRVKDENEGLHVKNLQLVSRLNESEQKIKDIVMSRQIQNQNTSKIIVSLREQLESKEFELQEVIFSNESKIMELERIIQDRK